MGLSRKQRGFLINLDDAFPEEKPEAFDIPMQLSFRKMYYFYFQKYQVCFFNQVQKNSSPFLFGRILNHTCFKQHCLHPDRQRHLKDSSSDIPLSAKNSLKVYFLLVSRI